MKRIDLFQLMNAFQDEEFEPEEECFVDENKVKETVLAQVRRKKRKGRERFWCWRRPWPPVWP